MKLRMTRWAAAAVLVASMIGCSGGGKATGTDHPDIQKTREAFQKDPQTLSLSAESKSEEGTQAPAKP